MYRPWYKRKGQILFPLIILLNVICGFEAALTNAIFHGKTEVLVTPGLVKKDGLTLDTCASACVAEKTIKCQFFKFINDTRTCYLSETDHPNVKHAVSSNTQPSGTKTGLSSSSSKSSMGSRFEDLERSINRLKNVQKKVENLEETDDEKTDNLKALKKQSVKQVKAIVNLDGRLRSLHTQVSDIGNDLLELQKSQRTIAKTLQTVRSSTANLGTNVKRLTHVAGELKSDVDDVKIFNNSINRQLSKVSQSNTNLDRKLNRLSSYLHDKRIFNPDNMQHTQFRITKGMSTLARSQKSFWNELRGMEHTVDRLTSTLRQESKGRGDMHSTILSMQTSIHNIKLALAKLSDPMSLQNRRWQEDVTSIKHVLSKLAGTNSRLEGEMRSNRRAVASVIKDLTNVQMAVQSLKSNVDGIRTTNADLVDSVQELLKTKSQIPSILQMTKISTTILKALNSISRKERTLTARMKQFGDSISTMEKKIQTKDNSKKIQKQALLQLSSHVKTLSGDLQRMNKLVVKIDKNQASAGMVGKTGALYGKLVTSVNKLHRKLADMDMQMKRNQNAAQRNSVSVAKSLLGKSISQWKTSLKALKSELKELRNKDRSIQRTLDKLDEEVKKGRLKPRIMCPMGTLRKGNRCLRIKAPGGRKRGKGRHRGRKKHVRGRHHRRKHRRGRHHRRKHVGRKHHRRHHARRKHHRRHHARRHHRRHHARRRHHRRHNAKKRHRRRHHARKRHHRRHHARKRQHRRHHAGKRHHRRHHARRERRAIQGHVERVKRGVNQNTKMPVALADKQGPACPSGYQLVDLYCFMYLPKPQTFDMARQHCQNHKGALPEVTSRKMQQSLQIFLLAETRAKVPSVWLSATVFNTDAQKWYWENSGDPLLFENYMTDPPAGQAGVMCNQFRVEWDSHWSANPCNKDIKLPTVCYHTIDHVPLPTAKLPYGLV
ncbi:uncharacterized protein LOC132562942 [Ylistrum balloti]|uniref:uncharacterized protein LOC132562942 n=1 Tax=Ylistrum balloti TaxID=509963 RepID=UPI002905EB8E|nr:uncharacterized protein LOC132562942 [Ylistrum balloti]